MIFFVISGFIIPFTLHRAQYRLADYGTFLLKRIVRLDPPYLATIALIVAMGVLASHVPGFQGAPFAVTLPQLLAHLGYANVIFGYEWLSPVFWTLAIELQYYLLVGLLFPLLGSTRVLWRTLALAGLACLSFASRNEQWLLHWLIGFLMGIVTFQWRADLISRRVYLAWMGVLAVACFYKNGPVVAATSSVTALLIAFWNARHYKVADFFGCISYSLYLVHMPVGFRMLNVCGRFAHNNPERYAGLLFALGCVIAVAWCMYRFVERPSQRWSTAITYRRRAAPLADTALP